MDDVVKVGLRKPYPLLQSLVSANFNIVELQDTNLTPIPELENGLMSIVTIT